MEDKKSILSEIISPFTGLFKTSTAQKAVNFVYLIQGLIYFGTLTLLIMYFNKYIGLNDIQSSHMVGFLTAGITLGMLVLGATVDWIGIRKALLYSFVFFFMGSIVLLIAPFVGKTYGVMSPGYIAAFIAIILLILGNGIFQPACYSAIKSFTNKESAPMGYAMLYALMNLGGFLTGIMSPPLRNLGDSWSSGNGILWVFGLYAFFNFIALVAVIIFITDKSVKKAKTDQEEENEDPAANMSLKERAVYYIKNFPFKDLRFLFFIFILIPVQTLFAHNWLTIPLYCERAFQGGIVSNNFEFFSNINPLLIFVLAPIVASLTTKADVYKMMIYGTLAMALPTFFLTIGPSIYALLAFLFFMTVGEAMWQPRFLQLIADIAPKGMTGIYMGLGQFPWFLTKVITSLYSGWFLMNYCPADTPVSQLNTEFMWLIYALIALISPIGLILAGKWMKKGFIKG